MAAVRTTAEIREGFLSFFEEKGHLRCPRRRSCRAPTTARRSSRRAGMQPQMPYFLGREPPPAPLTTTAQKCFRTPDIDEVGLDTYHLTFFEMMGNFSFGQYFKEGAIEYATEFIRERLKLDWDRIWVSVHAGDPELKLGPDQVAIDLWEKIGMPPERIVPLPSSENFWSVGGPGPVRPRLRDLLRLGRGGRLRRARLHARAAPAASASSSSGTSSSWSTSSRPDGTLTPLPKQNIDTGLGLERTARIVQNVPLGLRHRRLPADHVVGRRAVGRRVRRLVGRDEGAPRARRPRSRHDVPRRRRRHAVERGPRLRAAPRHPPRRTARAAHRHGRRRSSRSSPMP